MQEYDESVIKCFLENQLNLFPEIVAENIEEAEEFLEDCMAIVVNGVDAVWEYFEEQGIDIEGLSKDDIDGIEEVFNIGDGRYLIVEA